MEKYSIYEGFMEDLEKKVNTIRKKCAKYGCEFHFEKVGEEYREVLDYQNLDPYTNKPTKVMCKFIIVEAEGTAIVNGWEFVASVEHTEKGNIFSKALTDVEIPERYRTSTPYCEHCKSNRQRKDTFIVMNTETGEFKQVGKQCLRDFTHGMSASFAAYMAALKDVFSAEETRDIGFGCGYCPRYYKTEEFLRFTAETIRHYGFSKSNDWTSTKSRTQNFFNFLNGNTRYFTNEEKERIRNLIDEIGFNPESDEAKQMTKEALEWLDKQEESNDYMHNLKVTASLDYTNESRFGLLVSLFPTWSRELEREAKRRAETERGKTSEFVGNVKDRITVEVDSIKCVTSWESCYNGYSCTTTFIWKIVGKDGNIYIWKTSTFMDEDNAPTQIKGTVKEHKVYRDVKQTVLTRCRIEYKKEDSK